MNIGLDFEIKCSIAGWGSSLTLSEAGVAMIEQWPIDEKYSYLPPKPDWPAVVVVQPLEGVKLTSPCAMTEALAETLVRDFGDAVLFLIVEAGARPPVVETSSSLHYIRLEVSEEIERSGLQIVEVLNTFAPKYAYTFVELSAMGEVAIDQMVQYLGETEELDSRLFRHLVHLTLGPGHGRKRDRAKRTVVDPPDKWRVLHTELLGVPSSKETLRRDLAEWALDRIMTRLGRKKKIRRGQPYPGEEGVGGKLLPALVRCRLPLHGDLDIASEDVSRNLSRWGRALTKRRVGLALGGSGAWGYAHAALIDKMEEDDGPKIPIDLICSSSSGSLIGCYYSVLGAQGTKRSIERGRMLGYVVNLATITTASLELALAYDIGFPDLEELEVMLFPVATNLSEMKPEYITAASVPWGVRASCTAPGLFASTIAQDAVYVDGAVSDNVPSLLVEWMGADLVVSTNPLPPPKAITVKPPTSQVQQFFHEFSPLFRAYELWVSFALLCHRAAGRPAPSEILYEPPPDEDPLASTLNFSDARVIYDKVCQQDEFKRVVDGARKAWTTLSAPRSGLPCAL